MIQVARFSIASYATAGESALSISRGTGRIRPTLNQSHNYTTGRNSGSAWSMRKKTLSRPVGRIWCRRIFTGSATAPVVLLRPPTLALTTSPPTLSSCKVQEKYAKRVLKQGISTGINRSDPLFGRFDTACTRHLAGTAGGTALIPYAACPADIGIKLYAGEHFCLPGARDIHLGIF